MELERIEGNRAIYKENGKTITVIREFPVDIDVGFSSIIQSLIDLIEQEEKDNVINEK